MRSFMKKLISIISVFLIIVSIVSISERKVDADDTYTNSYTETILGKYMDSSLIITLGNHDEKTFKSLTIEITDNETGQQIGETVSLNLWDFVIDDNVEAKYDINYPYRYIGTFQTDKEYLVTITVESNYQTMFTSVNNKSAILNVCLERLKVTKEWNDNKNEKGYRPDINKYAGYINLNGEKPTELIIDDSNTDPDKYVYKAYGNFSIRDGVVITEDDFDNYMLESSTDSLVFYNPDAKEEDLSDDGYVVQKDNVSKAWLKNKPIEYFDLKLIKVDEDENPLEGAEFTITNIGTTTVKIGNKEYAPNESLVITSNENGVVELLDIPSNGKYKIEETKAPKGYKISDFSKEFTYEDAKEVQDQDNKLLDLGMVENEKVMLLIKKVWEDNNNKDNTRPDSINIVLKDKAGVEEDLSFEISPDDNGDWKLELTSKNGIKTGVEYDIKEVSVDGYTSSVDSSTADDLTTITITNKATRDDPAPTPQPDTPTPYVIPKTGVE